MIVELPDIAAVERFGTQVAAMLNAGDVVALEGPLGAGKTTLARAVIAALGHPGEVPSPTFAILEVYAAPPLRLPLVHADFYRLDDPREVAELGLDDYREGAVLLAEWPANAGGFVDEPGCLSITLEFDGEGRRALVEPGAAWQGRGPWL